MILSDELFNRTMVLEGGYVDDKQDPGGMTIFGLSRRAHPTLKLWMTVDRMLKESGRVNAKEVLDTYHIEIRKVYQSYADWIDEDWSDLKKSWLYDFGFNAGLARAKKLGGLNEDEIKNYILNYYKSLAAKRPYWKKGWTKRLQVVYNDKNIKL